MKKTESPKPTEEDLDELLPEYKFDYAKARPNRFAAAIVGEGTVVSLDPDVAKVFKTSESVNNVLRALIKTMPRAEGSKRDINQPSDEKNI